MKYFPRLIATALLVASSPAMAELQLCDDDLIAGNPDWIDIFSAQSATVDEEWLPCDVQFAPIPPLNGEHTAYVFADVSDYEFESLRFSVSVNLDQFGMHPNDIWTFATVHFFPPDEAGRGQLLAFSLVPFPSTSGYAVRLSFDGSMHQFQVSTAREYPLNNLQDNLSVVVQWAESDPFQISMDGNGLSEPVLLQRRSRGRPFAVATGLISELEFPIAYQGITVNYPVVTFDP